MTLVIRVELSLLKSVPCQPQSYYSEEKRKQIIIKTCPNQIWPNQCNQRKPSLTTLHNNFLLSHSLLNSLKSRDNQLVGDIPKCTFCSGCKRTANICVKCSPSRILFCWNNSNLTNPLTQEKCEILRKEQLDATAIKWMNK